MRSAYHYHKYLKQIECNVIAQNVAKKTLQHCGQRAAANIKNIVAKTIMKLRGLNYSIEMKPVRLRTLPDSSGKILPSATFLTAQLAAIKDRCRKASFYWGMKHRRGNTTSRKIPFIHLNGQQSPENRCLEGVPAFCAAIRLLRASLF